MNLSDAEKIYLAARRLAAREYSKNVSRGQSGYLPYLEGLLKNVEIVAEIDLGTVDIPLKKIVGTYTHSRSVSFASNFMPLLGPRTEFARKWASLCLAHLTEGIRDPIKVFEYLNWFYVVEGNKRVSVLKYFQGHSFQGVVTRLLPRKDENDPDIKIYYEFLEFNKKTGINCIWFTRENGFRELLGRLENFNPPGNIYTDKYKYFANSIYYTFRKVYHELGGGKLPITTGDAFLEYIKIYDIPSELDETVLRQRLRPFLEELGQMAGRESLDIRTDPIPEREGSIISTISTFVVPKRKYKVAFAYAKDIKTSSWTYSHEMGRLHVEKELKDLVITSCISNVPENMEAYSYLKQLAEEGNDIVFATSPSFINATLKAALEYPDVRFLNCSETHSFKHVNTYFGRIHEARFLAGVAAGAVTKTDMLGYVGTHKIPGVISGINAFALGARMVNPDAKIYVAWTHRWDDRERTEEANTKLIRKGVDIICHHDTLSKREYSPGYGVYTVICDEDVEKCVPNKYIAAPVWNWGIFYERIIKSLLNDTWKGLAEILGAGQKPVNFWWGMDSGVVDFFYSTRFLPKETQKLINFLKRMIISGEFQPFSGPIYDQGGKMRIKRDSVATHDEIITMDWFVDAVEGEI